MTRLQFDYLHPERWNGHLDGEFDVVLHCAGGGMGARGPLITAETFQHLFNLNLGYAAEVNRYVLPSMMARRSGTIVHVCSIASNEALGSVGYNTVKASLAAYVRSLGRELTKFQVVITGIAPGAFIAPGGAMERLQANHPAAYAEFIHHRLPRGRMADADELVPLIEFLCGPGASMMAGCVVPIDAGEGSAYV